MADVFQNPVPENYVDPDEPGIAAHYAFPKGMLARYAQYKNQHGLYGPTYDLTVRNGNPLVGQKYGILANNSATTSYQGALVATGIGLVGDLEFDAAPSASRNPVTNTASHVLRITNLGRLQCSLNAGVTYSQATYSAAGRGRIYVTADYDGANQNLRVNGRLEDSDAVVFAAPAATAFYVGFHGTTRRAVVPTAWLLTPRQRYVKEFARNVQYAWRPRLVGEGPVGGIQTGMVGEGDWSCPLGGADLKFAPTVTQSGDPVLSLTDAGAISMRRLDFMHTRMPAFGSWLFRYKVRDPMTDNPRFALHSTRGGDFTAAGAGSYWVESVRVPNPWWRTYLYRDNGAALLTVDTAVPNAGDEYAILLTRHPSGDWRLWVYRYSPIAVGYQGWHWVNGAVANDVTYLSSNFITIAPRNSYVLGVQKYLGEMDPHDLSARIQTP